MSKISSKATSVLIVERDDRIRLLMSTVLRHADCRTRVAADTGVADDLLAIDHFDVVVRDRAMQTDELLAADVLRRTILTTTHSSDLDRSDAYAVILKPFDIEEFVHVVVECAQPVRDDSRSVDMSAVDRFMRSIPDLRRTLATAAPSQRELLLRGEMRRTILALSSAFRQAGEIESNSQRAAAYGAASLLAAELAGPRRAQPRGDH